MKFIRIKTFYAGILVGLIFALAQAFLGYSWKNVYAYCTVGHSRDLILWLTLKFSEPEMAEHLIPLLSTIGVIFGAFIASKLSKEFHIIKLEKNNVITMFILGFSAAIFGLIATFCPIRLFMLLSYGDIEVLLGFLGYALGIFLTIKIMRR
ncbi:MAG: YeeE/YedE family protein [Nitrososphaeria archaeon]|nr:YeeE/YedE family protein [Nitrososphaeria archaeon]